jgi:hypothetical protein
MMPIGYRKSEGEPMDLRMEAPRMDKRMVTLAPWLLVLATLILACDRSPYRPPNDDPASTYMEACFPCHVGGPSGPQLAGRKLSPESVEKKLRWGGRGMPSFPGIRGQARRDLADYVSRLSREGS